MASKIIVTAFDASGNPITSLGENGVEINFILPNADPSKDVYLFKLVTGTFDLAPQNYQLGTGYPAKATFVDYVGSNGYQWKATLTTLSDIGAFNGDGPHSCFIGTTKVLMANGELKQIKDIKRGDKVVNDMTTRNVKTVANVLETFRDGEFVRIPKKLINNTEDIIVAPVHPFWVNNDNDRVLAKDIQGIITFNSHHILYNLQFEDEGTYYVEGVKVDSLSPNHKKFKLHKNLFFNKNKFIENKIIRRENDNECKPKLIGKFVPE